MRLMPQYTTMKDLVTLIEHNVPNLIREFDTWTHPVNKRHTVFNFIVYKKWTETSEYEDLLQAMIDSSCVIVHNNAEVQKITLEFCFAPTKSSIVTDWGVVYHISRSLDGAIELQKVQGDDVNIKFIKTRPDDY